MGLGPGWWEKKTSEWSDVSIRKLRAPPELKQVGPAYGTPVIFCEIIIN